MFSGKNLRTMRNYNHMTQKELSEKLHVSPALISAFERGKCCPDLDTVRRMCALFVCSVEVFLRDDAQMPNKRRYEAAKKLASLSPEIRQLVFQIIELLEKS